MKALKTVQLFIPAAFCALISMMALFAEDIARPTFFAFLPMCFFFVAIPMLNMNKRIADIEAKLKQAGGGDEGAAEAN